MRNGDANLGSCVPVPFAPISRRRWWWTVPAPQLPRSTQQFSSAADPAVVGLWPDVERISIDQVVEPGWAPAAFFDERGQCTSIQESSFTFNA